MHKNKLLPAQLLGSRKGKLQPSCLSQAQLTVAALVVHPAAGAANGVLPNPKGVVVKQGLVLGTAQRGYTNKRAVIAAGRVLF